MEAKTATQARSQLYSLIDQVCEDHRPVHIQGKRGAAVLVAAEDWSAIEETLYLLAIPGMRDSLRKGMQTPIDKCSDELRW